MTWDSKEGFPAEVEALVHILIKKEGISVGRNFSSKEQRHMACPGHQSVPVCGHGDSSGW